jgi:hypothetical protein
MGTLGFSDPANGCGMAANRWAYESSHPKVRSFVRSDKARDALELELTDPTVPWVYFYKFWEPSSWG